MSLQNQLIQLRKKKKKKGWWWRSPASPDLRVGRGTGLPRGRWSGREEAVPGAAPREAGRGLSRSREHLRDAALELLGQHS